MSSKVWSIGIQKHTKMIQHHVHVRSAYQFNQVGVHQKMTELRSIMWITIVFGCAFALPFPHRLDKFMDCLLTDLCSLNGKFC